ncbi:outer membrane protein assembly factor BamA [Acidisphaera sp. L21]|uniref:outer membrane protein assembly factor BamA n=1 Tax=Acidisphaera sp. L21 TaxID=1641851 RepID=UPI00210FDA45|nr:outer membrane protein assembly factor BamA [Acidisphaera sp. L21]
MSRIRLMLLTTVCIATLPMVHTDGAQAQTRRANATRQAAARSPTRAPIRSGAGIAAIKVTGNQRIEPGTIQSYMLVQPGDAFDPDRIDRSLKTLYATGLFKDVSITRDGQNLVVKVVENPIVNRIAFEGNHKIVDTTLRPLMDLRPRAVFTSDLAQSDRQKILDAYAKRGRFGTTVEPKIVRLDQNRVDVIFEINEGSATLVSKISFVGNRAFSESRLREIISSREQAFYRFLSSSDTYDPARIDYDKELLRRFYLKNGYTDFEVKNATAELAPDRSSFFVTFTMTEGAQYSVGSISIDSKLRNLNGADLLQYVEQQKGEIYDGEAVERSVTALQDAAQARGYNFVLVRPRIARDAAKHTVDLVFDVTEGPRIFVERIDIQGNTRTKDKVIRRELQLAEGDAFNAAAIRRSRQRLNDLGYFNTVNITSAPGSTPDKAIVTAAVDEKATGELSLGGGFSTDAGALLSAGLREKNLIGTGIDASLSGVLAQKRSEINFSATDPYFLDQNLVAGVDVFHVENNNQSISNYNERRTGFSLRLGYEINDHLRQALAYSLVDRNVYDVTNDASLYVQNEAGGTLLSQIGQTLTLDYRDSQTDPHTGFVIRYGLDVAGLGGTAHYVRNKLDGTYYIPLERFTGDSDWGIAISAGAGYLNSIGNHTENIIDRFFLGGDNLRGFQSGGAGPHSVPIQAGGIIFGADSVGGNFIYTQSTELRFPLPISADLGLSGRAFVDVGGLSQVSSQGAQFARDFYGNPIQGGVTQKIVGADSLSPRVGTGVGVSWKTPFGLINIDLAQAVVKKKYDQTQFFRFGFGTRF